MNNKGFTLIELIATMSIMVLLMTIALPNVTSIVDKNKRASYIDDAKKMVALAKYKFESELTGRPGAGDCKKYQITVLDRSDLQIPPYGGRYEDNYSFVTVKYNNSTKNYIYSVQLVERFTSGGTTYYRGVKLTENTALYKDTAKIKYVTDSYTNVTAFRTYANACS